MIDKTLKALWWGIGKIVKGLIYLTVAVVIVFYGRQYVPGNEVWVDFVTNTIRGKLLVPQDIAKTKDCDKFFQWQHDNLPAAMHGICPWYVYTPEREVTIGSLKLKIPRKYLLLGAEVERDTDIITTHSFIYPSLDLEGGKYSHDSFGFTLEKEYDDRFEDPYKGYLWRFLHITDEYTAYNIIPLGYDNIKELSKYRFDIIFDYEGKKTMYQNYVYTNDDINHPKDFVVCNGDKDNNHCKAVLGYKDIYVKYLLECHLLNKPKDVKGAVIKLIKTWEIE